MDTKRIILLAAIAFIAMQLWTAWQKDYGQTPAQAVALNTDNNSLIPDKILNSRSATTTTTESKNDHVVNPLVATNTGNTVKVITDTLQLDIASKGANIVKAALPQYPVSLDKSDQPTVLLNTSPQSEYLAQSTFISKGAKHGSADAYYKTSQQTYKLGENDNEMHVDFKWMSPEGVEFIKRYEFTRGDYDIGVKFIVNNASSKPWQGNLVTQLARTSEDPSGKKGFFNIHAYFGASVSTEKESYKKLPFGDFKKKKLMETSQGGWAAMQQHYFLSAWIPEQKQENLFYTHVTGNDLHVVGVRGPQINVNPGASEVSSAKLYVGPELPEQLKTLAPHLNMTVDYGWLWFISDILYWMMSKINMLVGNWGWSIIILTLLIKALFYPLSAASYRSMSRMRLLQPKIATLRERYADDKQKLTKETMELYRREKVNPFGGCLPILIQIPIFIALYWVLVESVQLRQAPFIFWIHDLSIKDPFYILPILMGITMLIQQRMNPAPPDPVQAKVMMMLPIVFTILFMNFPAGLVLYWVVNNTISMLQQGFIMHQVNSGKGRVKQKRLKSSAAKK